MKVQVSFTISCWFYSSPSICEAPVLKSPDGRPEKVSLPVRKDGHVLLYQLCYAIAYGWLPYWGVGGLQAGWHHCQAVEVAGVGASGGVREASGLTLKGLYILTFKFLV